MHNLGSSSYRWRDIYLSGSIDFNSAAVFTVNSAERARIDGSGNFGIGTSSPGELLEVNSDGSNADGAVLLLKHANNNTTDVLSTIKFANNSGSIGTIQAGTAGSNSTGYITFNTDITNTSAERMRIHTNGYIGIGTTSPSAPLHVVGNSYVQSGTLYTDAITAYSGQSLNINAASSHFSVTVNGSERARIDSSGNLLVGTTNTAAGAANTETGISLRGEGRGFFSMGSDYAARFNRNTNDGNLIMLSKDGTTVGSIGTKSSRPYLVNNVDGGINLSTDGYGRALLLPADQTGSPEDNLHYLGSSSYRWRDLYLSGTANVNALDITSGSSIHGTITTSSSSLTLNARNTGIMIFQSGGSEKARIDSSGNFYVGTTDSTLYSATSGGGIYAVPNGSTTIARQSTSSTQPLFILNETGVDGTLQEFRKDGSIVGSIATTSGAINLYGGSGTNGITVDSSGNLTATGNVTAFSDERLKENIETLQGSKVLEMRGVSYTKDGELSSGVIAQEIEKIAPELVHTAKDEIGTKSVAYGNLVGYLIEAIKDQQKQIDDLKERLDNGTS